MHFVLLILQLYASLHVDLRAYSDCPWYLLWMCRDVSCGICLYLARLMNGAIMWQRVIRVPRHTTEQKIIRVPRQIVEPRTVMVQRPRVQMEERMATMTPHVKLHEPTGRVFDWPAYDRSGVWL